MLRTCYQKIHQRSTSFFLMLISLLALILRIPGLNYCMAPDEAFCYKYFSRTGFHTIFMVPYGSGNHQLSSLLSYYSTRLLGQGDWAIHLPAMIFGMASIPLGYLVAKQLFGKRSYGLLSALFLAISPYHIAYSTNFRGYIFVLFFALVVLYMIFQLFFQPSLKKSLLLSLPLGLCIWLTVLSHFAALSLYGAWAGAWAGFALAVLSKKHWRTLRHFSALCSLAIAACISLALIQLSFLPCFSVYHAILSRLLHGEWTPQAEGFLCGAEQDHWHPFVRFTETITGLSGPLFWAAALLILASVLFTLYGARKKRGPQRPPLAALLCLSALLCPVLGILAIQLKLEPRYTFPLVPFYILLLAYACLLSAEGIDRLSKRILPNGTATTLTAFFLLALLLLQCLGSRPLYQRSFPFFGPELACVFNDHKASAIDLQKHIQGDDLVYYKDPLTYPLEHYLDRKVFAYREPSPEPRKHLRLWTILEQDKGPSLEKLPDNQTFSHVVSHHNSHLWTRDYYLSNLHAIKLPPLKAPEGFKVDNAPKNWTIDQYGKDCPDVLPCSFHKEGENSIMVANACHIDYKWKCISDSIPCPELQPIFLHALMSEKNFLTHGYAALRYFDKDGVPIECQRRAAPCVSYAPEDQEWTLFALHTLTPPQAASLQVVLSMGFPADDSASLAIKSLKLWGDWPEEEPPHEVIQP